MKPASGLRDRVEAAVAVAAAAVADTGAAKRLHKSPAFGTICGYALAWQQCDAGAC
jgi:hypothetical protein